MKRVIVAIACILTAVLFASSFAEGFFTIPMDDRTYEEIVWPEDIDSEYDYIHEVAVFTVVDDKDFNRVFRSFMDYQKSRTGKEAWLDEYRNAEEFSTVIKSNLPPEPETKVADEKELEGMITELAAKRQDEFEFYYAEEYDLSFEALERFMYRAGVQNFSWQMSLQNRTYHIYDIVYEDTEIVYCENLSELTAQFENRVLVGKAKPFLLNADQESFIKLADDDGALLVDLLSNSGVKTAELQYWREYEQMLVSGIEVYEAIRILDAPDSLNEEQKNLSELANAIASRVTLDNKTEVDIVKALTEELCSIMSRDESAELKNCDSEMYANMFYLSAKAAGLDVQFVSGTVDGNNRLWNAVNYTSPQVGRYYVDVFAADRKDIPDPNAQRAEPAITAYAYINFTQETYNKYAVSQYAPVTKAFEDDDNLNGLTEVENLNELINWLKANRKKAVQAVYQLLVNDTVTSEQILNAASSDWQMSLDSSKGRSGCYAEATDDGRTFVDIFFKY